MVEKRHLLELVGITKHFGSFCANDHIDLHVKAGEVHAVLGENGAGKSTLMNIVFGLYRPDAGRVYMRGEPVRIASPKDALRRRIGMVHQNFVLVGSLSCTDNICLLEQSPLLLKKHKAAIRARITELQRRYGIDVDIDSPVEQLSIGAQQKVEILKLLYTGSEVLIFDEPTAVLMDKESENLIRIVRNLAGEGKGVLFISHKIEEVLQASDYITVLAHGKVTGETPAAGAGKDSIVRMMVGAGAMHLATDEKKPAWREVCLRAENLSARDNRGVATLRDVSLSVHAGEIVGVAGVDGNGQVELAEVLAGCRAARRGRVFVGEAELKAGRGGDFIESGVGYVPADRHREGTVPAFPLYDNWILRSERAPPKGSMLDYAAIQRQTKEAMRDFDIRARGCAERSANLSGGNLQKLILARELSKKPKVLVCSYPTRGLDIRSTWFVRNKVIAAKNSGTGVLLISSDFEELFALSDRIVVIFRGEIAGEVLPQNTSVQEVGRMMMGVAQHAEAI